MLFPKIFNKKAFIVDSHPVYHPASSDYITYWKEQKKRCVEGFWAEDYDATKSNVVKYRYMPGPLYFYGNMATIKTVDDRYKITAFNRPSIDDVEWIIFTVFLVCRGFSGFENDTIYSCNEKYNTKENIDVLEKRIYVDPWEYLKKTHDKPLGRALYENPALNLLLLSSRGIGKTFSVGSLISSEILLDGAKVYNNETIQNPANITVFVGAYKGDKSINLLNVVDDIIDNLPGAYGKGDNKVLSPFHKELTGVNKPGSIREHSYRVKEGGDWINKGSKSKIVHEVVTVANPQAPAAYRATMAIIEEIGLLEADIEEVLGATSPVLLVGGKKFGSFIGIGTGGNVGKVAQLENIFRNSSDYKFFSMHDIFENMGEIGLFIPAQYMFREFKDVNGNTIWEKADAAIEKNRKGLKYQALEQEKMNYPVIPSEIFMHNFGSVFPVDEINKQLKWVIAHQKKIDAMSTVGQLYYTETGVKIISKDTDIPIRKFPLEKGSDLKGAVVIYEHPPEYIPDNLYKIVYDPVRDDNIDKMDRGISLAAIYVYKAIQKFDGCRDQLVAHYVGRLPNTDDIHEIAIKLAIMFRAKIMVEMDLPGFYKYCINTKKYSFLAASPWITIGKLNSNAKRRYSVGIMMRGNSLLKIQAEQYISRWLLQERDVEVDEEGNITRIRRNIDYIYDKSLLEELKNYNRTGNFDRVSALLLLMIWLEETKEVEVQNTEEIIMDRFDLFMQKHFK